MLRQRAISAAILVPPLLVALLLGGPWIVASSSRSRRVSPRARSSQLLTAAGYPPASPGSGSRSRSPSSSTRRSRPRSTRAATSCSRSGRSWRRSARSPGPIRATGCRPGSRRCSGRSTRRCSRFVLRLGDEAPAIPAGAPLAGLGARAGLDPAARPGGLGVRHRRLLRRQAVRAAEVPDPHLAVEDVRRADRRDRRRDGRRRRRARRARPARRRRARPRAARVARRAGRRPRRIDAQAGRRREGLGHA